MGKSHKQMPRPVRIEFSGAVYHIIARGDQDDFIFAHDRTARNSKIQGPTLGLDGSKSPRNTEPKRLSLRIPRSWQKRAILSRSMAIGKSATLITGWLPKTPTSATFHYFRRDGLGGALGF